MSRSSQTRQQQKLQKQQQFVAQQQIADNEAAAAASEFFDLFCAATTMRQILGLHRNMCDVIGLRSAPLNEFYPKLKVKVRSWKAQALWKKFDARAAHRAYAKGNACSGTRVLVIGAGPCGLRTAIEAQLLGAKVVVVEKRDRISRNNVLHLWPFVITDLRSLGAKKFYGKFCAGSIDHISIRQLQCILLKVALLLGVEICEGVSFDGTVEPSGDGCGWRAAVTPNDHAVSHFEFDVLIGADGKRNTLEGFKRKEFRGKLAIAITANFINKKTEAEAKAEEISGVAFIFNQSFFKELYHTTGIDLENIVYYKDETHYFVMTAKKHSLIDKGVIMQDFTDPAELLAPPNVNTEKLLDYAREAAEFSTKYQMPNLEFAVNHYGKPDVAMFDFTSMFAAETSCRVIVRKGFRLLQCLVGDSLLEPFWPTGSGCARGFLSSMDAAYAIKLWANIRNSTLGVLAQRESIYRLLNQTTPENLNRDIGSYTVDPATRYPNLNRTSVNVWQVKHLIDTDDKSVLEQTFMDTNILPSSQVDMSIRKKRRSGDTLPLSAILLRWICAQLHTHEFTKTLKEASHIFTNGKVLCALINRYRPDLVNLNDVKDLNPAESNEFAFKILENEMRLPRVMSGNDSIQLNNIESKIWLNYLEQICETFRGELPHIKHPKMDFSELREKYRLSNSHAKPDFSKLLQISTKQKTKQTTMQDMVDIPVTVQRRSVLDEEKVKRQRKQQEQINNDMYSSQTITSNTERRAKKRRNAEKAANIDRERYDIPSALPRSSTDEQFSDRIKSMEQRISSRNVGGIDKKPKDLMRAIGKIDSNDWNVREIEKKIEQSKKTETHGPKGREKVPKWSKEQFTARQNKMAKPMRQDSSEEKFKEIDQTLKNFDKQLKEGSILEIGERGRNKVASIAGQFKKKDDVSDEKQTSSTVISKSGSKVALAFKKQAASEKCHFCKQTVYLMEKTNAENLIFHRSCLKCHHCHTNLRMGGYAFDRDDPNGRFYCTQHFRLPAKAIRPVVRKSGQRKSTTPQQKNTMASAVTSNPTLSIIDTPIDAESLTTPSEKLRGHADSVAHFDLLDRGQTPERIEFENTDAISDGDPSEEHIIDEHEWSGRNFLPDSNNDTDSEFSSSNESDADSESDIFEEANDSPIGVQTLQLATDWIGKQNYSDSDDSIEFYDSSEGIADDAKDDSDEEEFKKARELRREEVRLLPLPANLPTDTETEVQSESESTSAHEIELNSATEISTDSEFDHDEISREAPKIFIDDTHLRKQPTKVQIKSTVIPSKSQKHNHSSNNTQKKGSYLKAKKQLQSSQQQQQQQPQQQATEFKPLVQVDPTLLNKNRIPLQNPRLGDYLLNKTASTEGIASKKSLELKKRYLLGEQASGNKIQKSGSTSVLDSRIRSFQSNISECQKLLNPAGSITPSMKTFLDRTKLGDDKSSNDLYQSTTTNNILNDLRVEITIQKASSAASTDNEKENYFVNSKNELNKGMEYSETINTTLLDKISKTPTVGKDTLLSHNVELKDVAKNDVPDKNVQSKLEFSDNNKIDISKLTFSKDDHKTEGIKPPDISKDAKVLIPDLLGHIEEANDKSIKVKKSVEDENQRLLSNSDDEDREEKHDSPKKFDENYENITVQIKVPLIPWSTQKPENISTSSSSCNSSHSSSVEDIQHYILDSTTSPDTNTGGLTCNHLVPRLEIHDSSGALLLIDGLIRDNDKINNEKNEENLNKITSDLSNKISTVAEEKINIDVTPTKQSPNTIYETDIKPSIVSEQSNSSTPNIITSYLKFDTKNESKVESLKNLPLIVDPSVDHTKVVKPLSLNLGKIHAAQSPGTPTTPTKFTETPTSPFIDNDKTPTADLLSRGSDSETEFTGTAAVLTETELSDWTADDCISENFIDIEFVLNSNKNTMKRNKKEDKKRNNLKLLDTCEKIKTATAPMADLEGMLKCGDIDDIEFMDTGSEGSCAETYSATNTAMLHNRGYMEFIEPKPKYPSNQKDTNNSQPQDSTIELHKNNGTKRDEKLGIDYIEQGAYIMQVSDNMQDNLKTPVNESPQMTALPPSNSSLMTQSLTDSSTINDLDDDSLYFLNSKTQTTEESEALTVVTSPLDSTSLKLHERPTNLHIKEMSTEIAGDRSSPSSSDKNPKTSTCTPTTNASTSSSRDIRSKSTSDDTSVLTPTSIPCKQSDEISYEEYVRALQQKITQISNARDSLDYRKHRRKSSKGDAPSLASILNSKQTVIEQTANKKQLNSETNLIGITPQIHKVPEIPTLTRKLEEITKERTKQKDLIHDLVMDKLQSKKQLNAEKRLHRSRQRSMMAARGCSSGLSPTPKIAAAATTNDTNCTNKAHYHVSSSAAVNPDDDDDGRINSNCQNSKLTTDLNFKENSPLEVSATYISPFNVTAVSSTCSAVTNKPQQQQQQQQRPFSENLETEIYDAVIAQKFCKTPSNLYSQKSSPTKENLDNAQTSIVDNSLQSSYSFVHPTESLSQQNRNVNASFEKISLSTENLRSEARARARLKSNSELGLSPEEKMRMLRERLNADQGRTYIKNPNDYSHIYMKSSHANRENDLNARAIKMSSSKSVNDIVGYLANTNQSQRNNATSNENSSAKTTNTIVDFTSDPNLLLSLQATNVNTNKADKVAKAERNNKTEQRDPDRRKSLIKSLSSFFHKGSIHSSNNSNNHNNKKNASDTATSSTSPVNCTHGATDTNNAATSANTNSIDGGGVFSRFRISSNKAKEKSKSCYDIRNIGFDEIDERNRSVHTSNNARSKPTTSTNCILHQQPNVQITTNNSHNNNRNKTSNNNSNNKKSVSSTFSTSSPQLYDQRRNSPNRADEQTPPPIPPLPLNYQRSDDESNATESREIKKQRAISKASRQAELKRLRIAQEIQREQEEIEVQLKELEVRGVLIEKTLRGEEAQNVETTWESPNFIGGSDEKLLKELLDIWRNITQLKKRDEELSIRQQELQLEHRHAQLKDELNLRLSCNKLEKSSADVAAEGAILNEMLEIVARRATLRPTTASSSTAVTDNVTLETGAQSPHNDESNI